LSGKVRENEFCKVVGTLLLVIFVSMPEADDMPKDICQTHDKLHVKNY